MQIRRLFPSDAAAYQALRLQGLRECPASFSSSYEEECDRPLGMIEGFFAPGGRNMFGAFIDGQLVGMVAVGREERRKEKHKGFVRGMYVAPSHRQRGVGRHLLAEAIAFVESLPGVLQINLAVTAGNAAAIALYESMGFQATGSMPGALMVDGALHDELQMMRPVPAATTRPA